MLDVRRFRSSDHASVGVLVAGGAGMDLHEGVVSGNPLGANVQDDDFDIDRLWDEVLYVDNRENSNRQTFSLPGPIESLDFEEPDP